MNTIVLKKYIPYITILCVLIGLIMWYLYSKKKINIPTLFKPHKKLIFYYTDSCGFCNRFKPVWEKIEENQKILKIDVNKVDCNKYSDIADSAGITEYPTLHLHTGELKVKYDGDFTYEDVVKFVSNN
jgi:thiol-disulfide isomerase/thioredoxin